MIKHLSILPLFALLVCSACDDSKNVKLPKDDTKTTAGNSDAKSVDPENRDAKSSTGSSSVDSTGPNPTGAFERKLDGLVTQKAPWGDIQISVEKAREVRGSKPEGFPTEVKHSTTSVYAIVDLTLDSKGDQENDYKKRDTWDLVLKDGTRVKPLAPLGVVLAAGGTKNVSVFYQVEDNAKLEGASLEINGSDRAALEPLPIPLDVKAKFASQVKLSDLVGETFEPDDGSLRFEILDAVYGVNLEDTGRRAPRDQRLVELKVRVGYNGDNDQVSFSSSDDAPRVSIGDKSFAPDAFDTRTIESGETHDFVMVYPIAETASMIDLVLDAGNEEMESDIELPSLLDGDTASDRDSDKADNSSDDSDDEADTSDDDSDDSFDSSDDNSDDSFDSWDDNSDESFDDDSSEDSFDDDSSDHDLHEFFGSDEDSDDSDDDSDE